MTSKEGMLRALALGKPDRLPVTVHQWQQYHLDTYLGGMDALAACQTCGLDASIQYFEAIGQFWIPNAEKFLITTLGGELTYKTGGNRTTTWITENLIKKHEEVEFIEKYMPVDNLKSFAAAAKECLY